MEKAVLSVTLRTICKPCTIKRNKKEVIKYGKDTKSQRRNEIFCILNFIQSYSQMDPGNKKYWKTWEDYEINSCLIPKLSVFDSVLSFQLSRRLLCFVF